MSFKDLGLSNHTIHAIEDLGYKEPTTVQKDVIPSILAGKDIFTIAPAACGKTCSYIFPLVDIISKKEGQNILIISADSKSSVNISDKLSIFNRYHEETSEDENEANVIIGSPDLLVENLNEEKIDLSNINILVVDDINLIKKNRQLKNLDKILEILPSDKQNIVFTTRRSKETQDTLDKILKTPAEIKIDKNKESEVTEVQQNEPVAQEAIQTNNENNKEHKHEQKSKTEHYSKKDREKSYKEIPNIDKKALELSKKHKIFGHKPPAFLLADCKLLDEAE